MPELALGVASKLVPLPKPRPVFAVGVPGSPSPPARWLRFRLLVLAPVAVAAKPLAVPSAVVPVGAPFAGGVLGTTSVKEPPGVMGSVLVAASPAVTGLDSPTGCAAFGVATCESPP